MIQINVFSVGSSVKIGGSIDAVVTAVCIRENRHVTYEVVSWDGNTRRCEWLEAFEVKQSFCNGTDSSMRAMIGFINS